MSEIVVHILLFLVASLAIVGLGSCYADAADGPALRNFPRRFLMFLAGCGLLAAIMILLEHTVASVN
ncbi:MAG TPA: hypothetical protein VK843_18510 [Planctomycetota bacterium]|nr:hypothetical protein [Planctomycetota bacterium]